MATVPPKSRAKARQHVPAGLVHRIRDKTSAKPVPDAVGATATRKDRLRAALPATVDLLNKRQADKIESGLIDDYVALHWLEWNGGSLQLTITGRNICAQVASTYA